MSGQGMLGSVGVAVQNSYQAINTGSLYFIPVISEEFEEIVESIQETGMYKRFSESPRHKGMMSVKGGFSFEPSPTALGLVTYLACGSDNVTFASSIATHTMRPRDTSDWDPHMPLPGATVLVNRDVASGQAFWGQNVDQLQFEIAQGALMKCTVTMLGAFYQQNAEVAETFPVERPFVFNVASISWGGVAAQFARNVQVQLRNNIQQRWTLNGSLTPAFLRRENNVQVSGRLNLYFESNSLNPDFSTPTPKRLVITLTSDVASPAMFSIDIPKARLTTYNAGISGVGPVELNADFVGEYDTTSAYQIQFITVNSVAAYDS